MHLWTWKDTVVIILVFIAIFQTAFIVVRLDIVPSDILSRVKAVELQVDRIEKGTLDRWTKTNQIKWESELQKMNKDLKVPFTSVSK